MAQRSRGDGQGASQTWEEVAVVNPAAVDSVGGALPATFDGLQRSFTRDANKRVATEYRTDGTNTWTKTFTRDADGNITSVSQWVRS